MREVLVEGHSRRGRPLGRWRDRVSEYMCERGASGGWLDQTRRECLTRERWRLFCCAHILREYSWKEQGITVINR